MSCASKSAASRLNPTCDNAAITLSPFQALKVPRPSIAGRARPHSTPRTADKAHTPTVVVIGIVVIRRPERESVTAVLEVLLSVLLPVVLLTLVPGAAGPRRVGPTYRAAVDAALRRHRAGRAARDTCSAATTTTSRHPGAAPAAAAARGKATTTATAPHGRADTATATATAHGSSTAASAAHGRTGTSTAAHPGTATTAASSAGGPTSAAARTSTAAPTSGAAASSAAAPASTAVLRVGGQG